MKYKIKEGPRLIGIAMAQVNFSAFWAHIFVDCMKCNQSIGVRFNDECDSYKGFRDDQFIEITKKRGWSLIPGKEILCPNCRKELKNVSTNIT